MKILKALFTQQYMLDAGLPFCDRGVGAFSWCCMFLVLPLAGPQRVGFIARDPT
jgi:hypothetical protein